MLQKRERSGIYKHIAAGHAASQKVSTEYHISGNIRTKNKERTNAFFRETQESAELSYSIGKEIHIHDKCHDVRVQYNITAFRTI